MMRILQLVCAVLMLGATTRSAFGFALVGPIEAWQTPVLGYNRVEETPSPSGGWATFNGFTEWTSTPHNIGEGYRWNVPVLYYTYDSSFLGYFGSNGVHAVDSAVAILNGVPPASQLDINDYPPDEARINYTAAALHLFDLKSAALEMLISRLGLSDPERFTWTLRARILQPGSSCPFYDYFIIQRNFDPDTLSPSRYVNGNLFTYSIQQLCTPAFPQDRSEALEILVDPIDTYATALATPKITWNFLSAYGLFHIGLTRDDAAGLKYLYRTNNMNLEASAPDAQLFQTNNLLQPLFTSNLTQFAAQALTNNAAALQAIYPNLVITSTTNSFTNLFVTNVVAFLTNQPWAPVGTFQVAFTTNIVPIPAVPLFTHTFANVVTFQFINGRWTAVPLTSISQANGIQIVANQTSAVVITNPPFGLPGTNIVATNVTTRLRIQTGPVGEFAVLPTNFCDVAIFSSQFTNVIPQTNILATFTNNAAATNLVPGQVLQSTLSTVTYFTNHIFIVFPISCTLSNVAVRQGVDKVSFVRHDFDPLLSRFFSPVTNDFDVIAQTTNNIRYIEHYRRIVTRPDILFAAGDGNLTIAPFVETVDHVNAQTIPNFNTSQIPPNPIPPEGPGTIEGPAGGGPMVITFNKTGPTYVNSAPIWFDENSAIFYYQWASFDGSTNAPILYPNSASLAGLEEQSFIQVSPPFLPAAAFGTPYSATLSVSGGQAPYAWSLSPLSSPLPPGLSLDPIVGDGSEQTISGTPGVPGTYAFIVRVTDSGGLLVDTPYVITVAQP